MIESERRAQYVKSFKSRIVSITASYIGSSGALAAGLFIIGPEALVVGAAVSGGLYILGTVADLHTTQVGLKLGATELSPALPARPIQSQLIGPRELAKDSISLTVGMMFPPVGASLGINRLSLAVRNAKKISNFLSSKVDLTT